MAIECYVQQPRETRVTCETCQREAIRREAEVSSPGRQARTIPYDTHMESLTEEDHRQALIRMQNFYSRLYELLDEIKEAMGTDMMKLSFGRIVDLDLGNVIPTACLPRSDVMPDAVVRANALPSGTARYLKFDQVPLEGLTLASLLEMARPVCESAAQQLKALYDARHPGD